MCIEGKAGENSLATMVRLFPFYSKHNMSDHNPKNAVVKTASATPVATLWPTHGVHSQPSGSAPGSPEGNFVSREVTNGGEVEGRSRKDG